MRVYFIFTIILVSCTDVHNKQEVPSFDKRKQIAIIEKKKKSNYIYQNDTLLQLAEIEFTSSNEIIFSLKSINKRNRVSFTIEGNAISNENADLEIDDDESGNAYPAQEFSYNNKCSIRFRIDAENMDKLKVVETKCVNFHDQSTPWKSVGILRLK